MPSSSRAASAPGSAEELSGGNGMNGLGQRAGIHAWAETVLMPEPVGVTAAEHKKKL